MYNEYNKYIKYKIKTTNCDMTITITTIRPRDNKNYQPNQLHTKIWLICKQQQQQLVQALIVIVPNWGLPSSDGIKNNNSTINAIFETTKNIVVVFQAKKAKNCSLYRRCRIARSTLGWTRKNVQLRKNSCRRIVCWDSNQKTFRAWIFSTFLDSKVG